MTILYILGVLALIFLVSALERKFAPHSLINGFMSEEMADAVFP